LVKAGRARWSDETETGIRLHAGPAHVGGEYAATYYDAEVNGMEIYDNDGKVVEAEGKAPEAAKDAHGDGACMLTVNYLLSQMEKIQTDSGYIREALSQVKEIRSHPPAPNAPDFGAQAQAEAIGSIVKSREQTNQKLLATYEKMYDDIKLGKRTASSDVGKLMEIRQIAEVMKDNELFGRSLAESLPQLI